MAFAVGPQRSTFNVRLGEELPKTPPYNKCACATIVTKWAWSTNFFPRAGTSVALSLPTPLDLSPELLNISKCKMMCITNKKR